MAKRSDNVKSLEVWNVRKDKRFSRETKDNSMRIVKVAVRNSKGQFHGATNFVGGDSKVTING